jgi:urate oxidase
MAMTIGYGKRQIAVYRTYARPLRGITVIPESTFSGRDNRLFAAEIDVEAFGDNFIPAYTQGDNTNIVATDSMKNFVLRHALTYDGATLEGFLALLGQEFGAAYPVLQDLRLTGRELPFPPAPIAAGDGTASVSEVLFSRSRDDYATAWLAYQVRAGQTVATDHECGRVGLQLIKITGSSFANFLRDAYTTMPEQVDRPLFIHLDVYWTYADVADAVAADVRRYVAAEQVRDLVQAVFHQFVSKSIQHLVHEMGMQLLERFPQLAQVRFRAENRLWDRSGVADDGRTKVYIDPRPPYGAITLTLTRGS